MSAKKEALPDYWSVYKAINFQRFSKRREFTDKKTGKKMSYEFLGHDTISHNVFMQVFSWILWLSPVFVIIMISLCYTLENPISLFYGILVVIAYHFAAMYYIIRGPYLIISPVKKKGLFSRK